MTYCAHYQSLLLLVFLVAPLVQAQESVGYPPSAERILDRYVAVAGGQAAYDRIQNQITALTLSHDGQIVGHSTSYQTRAGDFRLIDVVGNKTTETGLNAGVAWRKTAVGDLGPQDLGATAVHEFVGGLQPLVTLNGTRGRWSLGGKGSSMVTLARGCPGCFRAS